MYGSFDPTIISSDNGILCKKRTEVIDENARRDTFRGLSGLLYQNVKIPRYGKSLLRLKYNYCIINDRRDDHGE